MVQIFKFIFIFFSGTAFAEIFYLDRVEINLSKSNSFYSKSCSNIAEVQGFTEKPLRYKVSLDCINSKNRSIGESLWIDPKDILQVLEKEGAKRQTVKLFCI